VARHPDPQAFQGTPCTRATHRVVLNLVTDTAQNALEESNGSCGTHGRLTERPLLAPPGHRHSWAWRVARSRERRARIAQWSSGWAPLVSVVTKLI